LEGLFDYHQTFDYLHYHYLHYHFHPLTLSEAPSEKQVLPEAQVPSENPPQMTASVQS
jgi:hypothetical protein